MMAAPASVAGDQAPAGMFVACSAATRIDGLNQQQGIMVIRPGWVAFLPTHASVNLAAGMAGAIVGVHRIEGKPI